MIAVITQARMGSTRLPGKQLADIGGKPMLQRVIERVKRGPMLNEPAISSQIVVATTENPQDEVICQLATKCRVKYYRGSEEDVLDRFYQAAKLYQATTIVRICGDCPLIDPQIINDALVFFIYGEYDYVTNRPSYLDGMDTEVFHYSTLDKAWRMAKSKYDREHVTPYMQRDKRLKIGRMLYEINLPDLKVSVDEPKDLELVRKVYRELGEYFCMEDILGILGGSL